MDNGVYRATPGFAASAKLNKMKPNSGHWGEVKVLVYDLIDLKFQPMTNYTNDTDQVRHAVGDTWTQILLSLKYDLKVGS